MSVIHTEKIHKLIKSSDAASHELAYLLLKSNSIMPTYEIIRFFERSFPFFNRALSDGLVDVLNKIKRIDFMGKPIPKVHDAFAHMCSLEHLNLTHCGIQQVNDIFDAFPKNMKKCKKKLKLENEKI